MKKILIKTTTTQIIKDGVYKPKSGLFTFVNDGDRLMYLGNNFLIRPGGSFSLNLDALTAMAVENGISVENETQFEVTFSQDTVGNTRLSGQLIEVFITKID